MQIRKRNPVIDHLISALIVCGSAFLAWTTRDMIEPPIGVCFASLYLMVVLMLAFPALPQNQSAPLMRAWLIWLCGTGLAAPHLVTMLPQIPDFKIALLIYVPLGLGLFCLLTAPFMRNWAFSEPSDALTHRH